MTRDQENAAIAAQLRRPRITEADRYLPDPMAAPWAVQQREEIARLKAELSKARSEVATLRAYPALCYKRPHIWDHADGKFGSCRSCGLRPEDVDANLLPPAFKTWCYGDRDVVSWIRDRMASHAKLQARAQ